MKEFRKTEEGLFICEECGKTYKGMQQLSVHIHKKHMESIPYFNKWLRDETDENCCICGKHGTKWSGRLSVGFAKTCGEEKCIRKWNIIRSEKGCFEKYGVKNNYQRKEVLEKR